MAFELPDIENLSYEELQQLNYKFDAYYGELKKQYASVTKKMEEKLAIKTANELLDSLSDVQKAALAQVIAAKAAKSEEQVNGTGIKS